MKKHFFKTFQHKIEKYGYTYSMKQFIVSFICFYGLLFVLSYYFKLPVENYLFLFIVTIIVLPFIILAQYEYLYTNKKFETIVEYLEQTIFAFKKNPKIIDTMISVSNVVDQSMQDVLLHAVELIKQDQTGDGYHQAFSYIESIYPTSRIEALHRFMLSVEENGGKYQYGIDILLEDIQQWVQRTYLYQKELVNHKVKIIISILFSIVIAGTMTILVPSKDIQLYKSVLYQISSTLLFVIDILFVALMQTKLNGKWFIDDRIIVTKNILQQKKNPTIFNTITKKHILINLILVVPVITVALISKNYYYVIGVIGLTIYLLFQPYVKQKQCYQRKRKMIEQAFPFWLRDISLQVQTLVVPLAIRSSIDYAPEVLKDELIQLNQQIELAPDRMEPYTNFLRQYKISNIRNAMNLLYSIQSLSSREIQIQLQALIKRNQVLLSNGEKLKNDDTLALIGFLMVVPMIFATLKLVVDLLQILFLFMSLTQGG